jgi:hypothetical protein
MIATLTVTFVVHGPPLTLTTMKTTTTMMMIVKLYASWQLVV